MKKSFFAILMLSLYGFFNPKGMFSDQLIRFIVYFLICFGFFLSFNSPNQSRIKIYYPTKIYWMIIGGIAISIIMASSFHSQSLLVSFITTLPFLLGYLSFYLFIRLKLEPINILKIFFWLTVASVPVFLLNLSSFPNLIFGEQEQLLSNYQRGIPRVPLVYRDIFVMFVFYGINKWKIEKSKKWVAWGIFCFLMVILHVTRQYIFFAGLLGLIFIVSDLSWTKRILILGIIGILSICFIPRIPIFKDLIELSQDQEEQNATEEEDVRLQAYEYYVNTNQTNELTRFLGNGVPSVGNSPWGNMFESETDSNKYFYVDIGWGGFYWLFGLFATFALLVIFLTAAFRNKARENRFLSYWMIYFILITIASGPNLYLHEIVIYMVGLYMCFYPSDIKTLENNDVNSNNNIKLQQRRRLRELREEC